MSLPPTNVLSVDDDKRFVNIAGVPSLQIPQNPFNLVLHNSDGSFNRKDLILFEKLPLLQRIYTQNINVEHVLFSTHELTLEKVRNNYNWNLDD